MRSTARHAEAVALAVLVVSLEQLLPIISTTFFVLAEFFEFARHRAADAATRFINTSRAIMLCGGISSASVIGLPLLR